MANLNASVQFGEVTAVVSHDGMDVRHIELRTSAGQLVIRPADLRDILAVLGILNRRLHQLGPQIEAERRIRGR